MTSLVILKANFGLKLHCYKLVWNPSHRKLVNLAVLLFLYANGNNKSDFVWFSCSVQLLSCVWLFVTPWTAACKASLSFTISQSFIRLMSVEDVMPSHPLSSPSPATFNLSQHQGLSQWVSSLHQAAKVLEFQLQQVFPVNIQDWFPLEWTGWISLQSKGLSRVFSNTTVQKNQFFGTQLSLESNSHIHTWLLEKP